MQESLYPNQDILPLATINNVVKNTIAELQAERSKQCKAIHLMKNKLQELNSVKSTKSHCSIGSMSDITEFSRFNNKTYMPSHKQKEDIMNLKLAELYEKCKFNEGENEERDSLNMIERISAFIDQIKWERKEMKMKYDELIYEFKQFKEQGKLREKEMLKRVLSVKSRTIENRKEMIKTHDVFTREPLKSAHTSNTKKLEIKKKTTRKRGAGAKTRRNTKY